MILTTDQRERFLGRIFPLESGCHEWSGARTAGGYGELMIAGRMRYAHRLAYEVFVGPIPEGKQIDHLCRNRACCNPGHLEAVTSRENTARGQADGAYALRTDHCKRGHPLSGGNLYEHDGRRHCRTCRADRQRASRAMAA